MYQKNRTVSTCEQLDLGRDPRSFLRLWGPPLLLIVIGTLAQQIPGWPLAASGLLWSGSIFWLGASCALNALRCGRFHCMVLGIAYPLLGLLALGITFGRVPIHWNPFWAFIFLPITLIAFIPEFFGLKYIGSKAG
ncbi:MAG: hypothetical protein M1570_14040 [Chloroflexi bacterium]|nr:hypothetical protein [Chloroflexota bacterium]